MERLTINDETGAFEASLIEAERPSRVVLFAVGGGGDPTRHEPLLEALAETGCSVIAPHFARMLSPVLTDDDLILRAHRLKRALDAVARPNVPAVGIGHSIGATMLLALAGARVWMSPNKPLSIAPDTRIERLALMAPATGFFRAPGALDEVHAPVSVWVGTEDVIAPPAQAELLRNVIGNRIPVSLRVVKDAGHFSFMNVPPPQSTASLPDRNGFLITLTADLTEFVVS